VDLVSSLTELINIKATNNCEYWKKSRQKKENIRNLFVITCLNEIYYYTNNKSVQYHIHISILAVSDSDDYSILKNKQNTNRSMNYTDKFTI
jgi:hypothetical protein